MKKDNKIFWKFIQSKTKSKENIPCIMDENGELQTDNKIKAELLNKFFQSVFTICKGVTFASFQVFGIFLVSIVFWNILVSGSAMFLAVSFRNFGCI
jgi:hypothetical protein